ncbi:MAG: hypothetical protein MJK18_02995 [Bdellovibrionales bacterium]|nr:hypothetical protein [Bdellovibrionales bacterium]
MSHESEELWSIEKKDLYKDDYIFDSGRKKVVIINPPWGKRLPANSKDLITFVDQKLKPDRLGILIPAFWKMQSSSMERVRDVSIMNSGVENRFLLYSRY